MSVLMQALMVVVVICLGCSPVMPAPPSSLADPPTGQPASPVLTAASVRTETPAPPDAVLFDNFDYEVGRSDTNAEVPFRAHGWTDVKANNSYRSRGGGFLYTQFDPILGSQVLVMESRPSAAPISPGWRYGQTDYYLKYGSEKAALSTIPANLWIQFWTYATPDSRFARRDKTIYPCRGPYPCQGGQLGWLFMWGSGGFEYETMMAPPGGRYLAVAGEHADYRGDKEYPTNASKLFQNVERIPLLPGCWYQVKLHFDVSGEQGVYEAWIRERGQPWKKVAEWIGGSTPNFFWPIPVQERVGFRVLALPTTVNGPDDSTTYMDDFVLAASEKDLP